MDTGNRKIRGEAIKRKRISFLLVLLILATMLTPILSGCKTIPDDFTKNNTLWISKRVTAYNFTLQRQCFCPEDRRGPVRIQVSDRVATSVVYTTSGLPANPEFFADIDTVDKIFIKISEAYKGKAERVDVTFDRIFGYPSTVYIDVSSKIADEEQGYTITDFQVGD